MATTYISSAVGDLLQNAPIDPRSQNFLAMTNGLFCNNGCDCDGELVDYTVTLTLTGGGGIDSRFGVSVTAALDGVSQTLAFPEVIDLTIPANMPAFEAQLEAFFGSYLRGNGGIVVTPTIVSGLVTVIVVTLTAREPFVPTNIKFLNGLNAETTAAFTVVP
jgi:hypothetical protein